MINAFEIILSIAAAQVIGYFSLAFVRLRRVFSSVFRLMRYLYKKLTEIRKCVCNRKDVYYVHVMITNEIMRHR